MKVLKFLVFKGILDYSIGRKCPKNTCVSDENVRYYKEYLRVNDKEFKKRLRKLAKQQGVEYLESRQGKGSHSRVYYGNNFTTVKHGEIGAGLLNQMCKQLGIDKDKLLEI